MQTPVVIFAYNRPKHLEKVLAGLLSNKKASSLKVVVYSDFPKKSEDRDAVNGVRSLLDQTCGFGSLTIVKRSKNFGLANSIIDGVTMILNEFDSAIILEDDVVPSSFFLDYMTDSMQKYRNHQAVGSVHAYSFPVLEILPETFFLRGADCWGWGTWKRSWKLFNACGLDLLQQLEAQNLCNAFDLNGSAPYSQMLRDQIAGKVDSWAIRWHASMFLAKKLCLYPGRSLVENIGMDKSGVHCGFDDRFDVSLSSQPVRVKDIEIEESQLAKRAISSFYLSGRSFQGKL